MSNKPLNTEPPPGSTHGSSLTRFQRVGALLLILLSLPAAVLAAPGDLDPSFDGDGRVLTDFGGFDRPFDVVRQPDGKLVAAGVSFINGSEDFSLARYHPDGSLDTEFGVLGRTVTDLGGNDGVFALVVEPDGKLVAAGFSNSGGIPVFALARYRPDGSLDPGFGNGGVVLDAVGGIAFSSSLVRQPDGKLVAAGTSANSATAPPSLDLALVRYNPDGSLDRSFGADGHAFLPLPTTAEAAFGLAIQLDNKLVATGPTNLQFPNGNLGPADFLIARFNSDGSLESFDTLLLSPHQQ